jgi:hypothetical protein
MYLSSYSGVISDGLRLYLHILDSNTYFLSVDIRAIQWFKFIWCEDQGQRKEI